MSVNKLMSYFVKLDKILKRKSTRFSFKRVLIPKTDGSMRPLAVPPLEWRTLANWQNTLFTIWAHGTKVNLIPNQFGVLKGGGLKATWSHLIRRIKEAKYIYEFDLHKFFDSIPNKEVKRGLIHYKFPSKLIERAMETIRWSTTVLKEERLLEIVKNEERIRENFKHEVMELEVIPGKKLKTAHMSIHDMYQLMRTAFQINYILEKHDIPYVPISQKELGKIPIEKQTTLEFTLGDPDKLAWMSIYKYILIENKHLSPNLAARKLLKDIDKFIKSITGVSFIRDLQQKGLNLNLLKWKELLRLRERQVLPFRRGVPQGFGMSPMLASFALFKIYEKWKDQLVMYLDDGLLISDKPIDVDAFIKDVRLLNIEVALQKSGMVKEEGKWLRNLKFLGLEYLPNSGNLKSNTKTGKTIELPALKFLELPELRKYFKFYTATWLDSIRNKPNIEKWDIIQALGYGIHLVFSGRVKDSEFRKVKAHSLLRLLEVKEGNVVSSTLSKPALDLMRKQSQMKRADFNELIRKVKLWHSKAQVRKTLGL